MKNQKSYIIKKIKSLTVDKSGNGFSYDTINEATDKVLELINKNIELGKIKQADQDVVDFLIYRVLDTYH